MNIFNEKEFVQICRKLNVTPHVEEVIIEYQTPGFFNKVKKSIQTDRRGEVAFCVRRPDGKLITVTCAEYPEGVFRIPTGGIGHDEDIIEAVFREAKEELGIDSKIKDFLGVLKIKFVHLKENIMFYSYLFVLDEIGGRLLEDATDDEVSEIREVDVEGLGEIVANLGNIDGKWSDWGRFRYETSKAFLQYFRIIDDKLIQ